MICLMTALPLWSNDSTSTLVKWQHFHFGQMTALHVYKWHDLSLVILALFAHILVIGTPFLLEENVYIKVIIVYCTSTATYTCYKINLDHLLGCWSSLVPLWRQHSVQVQTNTLQRRKKALCLLLPTEVQIYSWVCSGCRHGVIDNYLFQKSVGLPDVHSGYGFAIGMFIFFFVCVLFFPPQAHSTHFASEKRFFICGDLFLSPPPYPQQKFSICGDLFLSPAPPPPPPKRFFICGDLFLSPPPPPPPPAILHLWWSVPIPHPHPLNRNFLLVVICSWKPMSSQYFTDTDNPSKPMSSQYFTDTDNPSKPMSSQYFTDIDNPSKPMSSQYFTDTTLASQRAASVYIRARGSDSASTAQAEMC